MSQTYSPREKMPPYNNFYPELHKLSTTQDELVRNIEQLVASLRKKEPFVDEVRISTTKGWNIDYHNRRYIYVYSPTIQTLTLEEDYGPSFVIQPQMWTLLLLPEGSRVFSANAALTAFLILRCDEPLASPAPTNIILATGINNIGNVGLLTGTNNIGNVGRISDYPVGSTPQSVSSGNQANATASASLSGGVGVFTWITGFEVVGTGATAVNVVTVTITNLAGGTGTLSYTYVFVAGVTTQNQSLIVEFSQPLKSSATNVSIVVSCPASGAGGTNNTVNAHGYTL